MTRALTYLFVAGLLAPIPACIDVDDLPRIDPDLNRELDAGDLNGEPDTGPDVQEPPIPEGDGGTDSGVLPEGPDTDAGPDAAGHNVPGPDGTVVEVPESTPCSSHGDCSEDQVCGPTDVCIPRCEDSGLCLVTSGKRDLCHVTTEGNALYWGICYQPDDFGNPQANGEIWRKDPSAAPVRIAREILLDGKFEIRDEYAYFTSQGTLYRTALTADSTPQPLYALPGESPCKSWALGTDFIAFATSDGVSYGPLDGSQPLQELVDGDACGAPVRQPFAVSGDSIYFVLSTGPYAWTELKQVDVHAPSEVASTGLSVDEGEELLGVQPPYLYAIDYQPATALALSRYDLQDRTRVSLAGMAGSDNSLSGFIRDDWAYWVETTWTPDHVYFGRSSLTAPGNYQELLPPDTRATLVTEFGLVAASQDRTYFMGRINPFELGPNFILYEAPLPPPPCSETLPCQDNLTCGADQLCH